MKEILRIAPSEIEKKSFEIITEELGDRQPDQDKAPIVKRVIHTTADFDYADNLYFSPSHRGRERGFKRRGVYLYRHSDGKSRNKQKRAEKIRRQSRMFYI